MSLQVQPLDLGGILDHAVQLVKQRFGLLVGITFALYVPYLLIAGLLGAGDIPQPPENPTPEQLDAFVKEFQAAMLQKLPVLAVLGFIGLFIVIPICNAAMIHAIAAVYLDRPITIGAALSRAVRVLVPLLWTQFLNGLIVLIGLMLFIVPGIIFFFWYALGTYVVVLEGTSGMAALRRSRSLMKGNKVTLFILMLIVSLIGGAIRAIENFIPGIYLQITVSAIIQAGLMVFSSAAFVVFYFSCRCKNEHFDLALLAQAVGQDAPSGPESRYTP